VRGNPGKPRLRKDVGWRSPFSSELRRLRFAAGMTQVELARRAGLHRRVVEWAESTLRTEPKPETIAALERGLGMPGALRVGPCSVCGAPALVGRTWCVEHAPGGGR
jgi:transcriptional regulator with XRE-family HTH domain